MSFILDALKKSETERQQQGAAEFAGVPTSSGRAGAPRWLWILGLLLAINLAVLLGLIMRPDKAPQVMRGTVEASPPVVVDTSAATASEASFIERVAEARENPPVEDEVLIETASEVAPQPERREPVIDRPAARARPNPVALPTFHEVVANGTVELPALHLDIHVYSDVPEDRFVFINMSKQREQSQLGEGPVVEEITPDGVVLTYLGTSFLLPRD